MEAAARTWAGASGGVVSRASKRAKPPFHWVRATEVCVRVKSPPAHRLPLESTVSAHAPVLRCEEISKGVQCMFLPVAVSHAPTHFMSSARVQFDSMVHISASW